MTTVALQQLPDRAPAAALAAVLHAHPQICRYLVARHPPIEEFVDGLLRDHHPVSADELDELAVELLWEIADLIVYQRDPEAYDASDDDTWVLPAFDELDLQDKVVIDSGAGTGRIALAAARRARHVFAVEPATTLRRYLRARAAEQGLTNLSVIDGFLHAIPLPNAAADVLLTCRAIGWNLQAELEEIERVLKPGGIAVHLFGMPHPAPPDEELHQAVLHRGYTAGTYSEGSELMRKYSKRIPDGA